MVSSFKIIVTLDTLSGHSGTPKLALKLVNAFHSIGHQVVLLVVRKTLDWRNIESELCGIDIEFLGNRFSDFLSFLIEAPLIKVRMKGSFEPDDRVDFFGLMLNNRLRKKFKDADVIIFMNFWSAFSLLFLSERRMGRTVTYFHESYSPFPWPYKTLLDALFRKVVKKSSALLSVTKETEKAILAENDIKTFTLEQAVDLNEVVHEKDDYIIADTRWTKERNPFFILELIKLLPKLKIKVCGRFGSDELKLDFLTAIKKIGLEDRIEIKDKLSERELDTLYRNALCYVRWGALVSYGEKLAEHGPSFGVYQAISNGCIPIISDNLGSSYVIKSVISPDIVVPLKATDFANIIMRLYNERVFFDEIFIRILKFREDNTWEMYAKKLLNFAIPIESELKNDD